MDSQSTSSEEPADPSVAQQPKHIALVIHALHGGGAERLMSQLANRWSNAGHRVELITLAHTSTDIYSVEPGVTRHGLDLMRPSRGLIAGVRANWQRVRQLRKLLAQLSPDCVLSFCDRMNITTITAALPLSKSLWVAEHSDPSRQHLGLMWETWRQWAYRRLIRRSASGCVVLSESIAATMRNRFPGLDIAIIPPAIHLHDCSNTEVQLNVRPGEVESTSIKQVLSMGRHSPEKNLDGLLQAWREIAKQFPQWRLVLAGDGPEHKKLMALAHELQIDRSVQFAGWVSDPWSLYRQSDLLAMTSHYEGVPVAMLEAMGAGLACVSTPCASTVQDFAAAGGVQLAETTDPSDIARALSVAMADEALREKLAQRGRTLAKRFTWESIGTKWDELLNKLDSSRFV